MTIFRYRFQGNFTDLDLSNNVDPAAAVSFDAIGPDTFVDIDLQTGEPVADLTAFMNSMGWTLFATSPTFPPGVVEQGALIEDVVAVTAAGSVDSSVALFTGPTTSYGSVTVTDWLTRVDSATLGTTLAIIQPGIYSCNCFIGISTGAEVTMSLSLNATLAQRQGVAIMNDLEVYSTQFTIGNGFLALEPSALLSIDQDRIDAGDNVIRVLYYITTSGLRVPASSFANPLDVLIKIWRTGNIQNAA